MNGQRLKQAWDLFVGTSLQNIPMETIQFQEMQRMFYIGAHATLSEVIVKLTALSDDDAEVAMQSMVEETNKFFGLIIPE